MKELLFIGAKYEQMIPRFEELCVRQGITAAIRHLSEDRIRLSHFGRYFENDAVLVPWRQYAIALSEYRKRQLIASSRLVLMSGVEQRLGYAMTQAGVFDAYIPINADPPEFVEASSFRHLNDCFARVPNLHPISDAVYCEFYQYLDHCVGEFGVLDYIASVPDPVLEFLRSAGSLSSASWPHQLPKMVWELPRVEKRWLRDLAIMCRSFTTEWKERNMRENGEMFAKPFWGLPRSRGDAKEGACFVLMPFSETFQVLYLRHILPLVESLGIDCGRADEIFTPKPIMQDVWDLINAATFLIADTTGQNPNVMYEIGLAHAVGKSVILISQSIRDCPFDLQQIRHVIYEPSSRGVERLEHDLAEAIAEVRKEIS